MQVTNSGALAPLWDMDDLREILARNLSGLMAKSVDMRSQSALARRARVAQKTISNYLDASSYKGAPSLGKVEKIARAFGIETWQLIHPTLGDRVISAAELALYEKLREQIQTSKSD